MKVMEILKPLFKYKIAFVSICIFIVMLPVICSKKLYKKIYKDNNSFNYTGLKPINTKVISEKEDYEIYSTLINLLYLKDEKIEIAIVSGKTYKDEKHTPEEIERFLIKKMPSLGKGTLESFNFLNQEIYEVKDKFSTKVKTILSTNREFREFPENHFTFGSDYITNPTSIKSTGVVAFSRIGFNKDHTQCLVNVGYFCRRSCSNSQMVLLDKINGSWVISGKTLMWIT